MGNLASATFGVDNSNKKTHLEEKTSYYMIPESPWDYLPVSTDPPTFPVYKISTTELFDVLKKDKGNAQRREVSSRMVKAITENQFFIVQLSDSEVVEEREYFKIIKEFLDMPLEKKMKFNPNAQNLNSGYTKLFFDNRDNIREPEIRDVFQIRMGEEGHIPWPSEEFKTSSYSHYVRQWTISLAIIELILGESDMSFVEFKKLVTDNTDYLHEKFIQEEEVEEFHGAPANLSMFRYTDTQNYKTVQKCMVHRDNGFVTLLPKSTAPGIQVLHNEMWIPMEEFTKEGEMMVYLGVSSEVMSQRFLPALRHRVVRQPGGVRYSLPFELKANEEAHIIEGVTGRSLEVETRWERLNDAVSRVDSVTMTGS